MMRDRTKMADMVHISRASVCKSGLYMEYAKQLIEKGEAYYCFCDKERLDSLKQKYQRKRNQ